MCAVEPLRCSAPPGAPSPGAVGARRQALLSQRLLSSGALRGYLRRESLEPCHVSCKQRHAGRIVTERCLRFRVSVPVAAWGCAPLELAFPGPPVAVWAPPGPGCDELGVGGGGAARRLAVVFWPGCGFPPPVPPPPGRWVFCVLIAAGPCSPGGFRSWNLSEAKTVSVVS